MAVASLWETVTVANLQGLPVKMFPSIITALVSLTHAATGFPTWFSVTHFDYDDRQKVVLEVECAFQIPTFTRCERLYVCVCV